MYCVDVFGKMCYGVIVVDRIFCGFKKVGSDCRVVRGLFLF